MREVAGPQHPGIAAEPAGPLQDRTTFSSPRFGTGRVHLAPDRYRFDDAALYSRGKAGEAVAWRLRQGTFNDFWVSLNNRCDPALLRAQAALPRAVEEHP